MPGDPEQISPPQKKKTLWRFDEKLESTIRKAQPWMYALLYCLTDISMVFPRRVVYFILFSFFH